MSDTRPRENARLDALGLKCPLPVLRTRKVLAELPPGAVLEVLADDPVAVIDLPHFCTEAGHDFLGLEQTPEGPLFRIRRGG